MSLTRVYPPGTILTKTAIRDILKDRSYASFIDVGCGEGTFSLDFVKRGIPGIGIDFSKKAIKLCRSNLAPYIESGKYQLLQSNILDTDDLPKADLVFAIMVVEHFEDEKLIIERLKKMLTPDGTLLLCVPARMDYWSIEDETAGHFRRYDPVSMSKLLENNSLQCLKIYSATYPISNILFSLSNYLIRKSEKKMLKEDKESQTKLSGVRDIPFKTTFPSFFKLFLNEYVLYPLVVIQRLFYKKPYGLNLITTSRKLSI